MAPAFACRPASCPPAGMVRATDSASEAEHSRSQVGLVTTGQFRAGAAGAGLVREATSSLILEKNLCTGSSASEGSAQ
jgi:hypothetical protein